MSGSKGQDQQSRRDEIGFKTQIKSRWGQYNKNKQQTGQSLDLQDVQTTSGKLVVGHHAVKSKNATGRTMADASTARSDGGEGDRGMGG